MGTKTNPGEFDCYAAALPDEPYFVLLGRDPQAPKLLEYWARDRRSRIADGEAPDTDMKMVEEAERSAEQMRTWRAANDGKWRLPTRYEFKVWIAKDERPVAVHVPSPSPLLAAWFAVAGDQKQRRTPFDIEINTKDGDTYGYRFSFDGDNPVMKEIALD